MFAQVEIYMKTYAKMRIKLKLSARGLIFELNYISFLINLITRNTFYPYGILSTIVLTN